MKYLVDANVLSEPTRPVPDTHVLEWLGRNEQDVVVNPIILGELEYGILLLPDGKKRKSLEAWFARGAALLPVLDWNVETARTWAGLLASLKRRGKAIPLKDSLIAATALTHGLTVATRNTRDFRETGVKVVDPWKV